LPDARLKGDFTVLITGTALPPGPRKSVVA
jgi:hypothetical protein